MRRPVKVKDDSRDAKTIDQLIAEQGVSPVTSLELFAGRLPDADIDAMIDEIYRDR